jgi:hypothetical protein
MANVNNVSMKAYQWRNQSGGNGVASYSAKLKAS